MSAVETTSPRAIRARSIARGLSGEDLRGLARAGEKTTEYGSPVYSTRIKNRSAKKTYIVADGVLVGPVSAPSLVSCCRAMARLRAQSRRISSLQEQLERARAGVRQLARAATGALPATPTPPPATASPGRASSRRRPS